MAEGPPGGWLRRIVHTYAAALALLRTHSELWAMPLLSVLAGTVVALAISRLAFSSAPGGNPGAAGTLLLLGGAIVIAIVVLLGNAAVMHSADQVLRGGTVSPFAVRAGLRHGRALVCVLFSQLGGGAWLVALGVVTVRTSPVGVDMGLMLGIALLSVVNPRGVMISYLLPPVIVLEGLGYRAGRVRMSELCLQTWKDEDRGYTGVGLVGSLLFGPVFGVVLIAVRVRSGDVVLGSALHGSVLVGLAVWGLLVWAVTGAVQAVYRVVLYRFAAERIVLAPFTSEDLQFAFGKESAA